MKTKYKMYIQFYDTFRATMPRLHAQSHTITCINASGVSNNIMVEAYSMMHWMLKFYSITLHILTVHGCSFLISCLEKCLAASTHSWHLTFSKASSKAEALNQKYLFSWKEWTLNDVGMGPSLWASCMSEK